MKRRTILAEFAGAFTAILGPKFWPRLAKFVAAIFVLAIVRSIIADWSSVPSGSMIPTLLVGDRVLVNKLAYDLKLPFTTAHLCHWADPKRGDIIIFFSPANGLRLVKRVIAIPGDTVELRDEVLYLNGIAASYADLKMNGVPQATGDQFLTESLPTIRPHATLRTPVLNARRSFPLVTVPAGKYFVMGDNRDDSFDSRYFGFVDRSAIVGCAQRILFSLGDYCLPQWERLFRAIP